MTRENVDRMLHNYREYLGRCKFLEAQISEIESMIDELKRTQKTDASIHISAQDGMPHGSSVGHPTERIAMMFAENRIPRDIQELQDDLKPLVAEYREKSTTVVFVGAWLLGLKDGERWIIEKQVIDGETWSDIIQMYLEKFKVMKNKRTLQRFKDKVLLKIYEMAR